MENSNHLHDMSGQYASLTSRDAESETDQTSKTTEPEFYFSCHEKIVTGDYMESESSQKQQPMSDVYDPRDT